MQAQAERQDPIATAQTEVSDALGQVRQLVPMRYLTDSEFQIITSSTGIEVCAAGKPLFRRGRDDQSIFFLLTGDIKVIDSEEESFVISGGSVEARYPLSPHPRERVEAIAVGVVKFLRFPSDLMRLHEKTKSAKFEVEELEAESDDLDNRVMFEVYHAVMSNDIVLPSLPDVALRIREVANNPESGVDDVARIIRGDASTTAYCIGIANSAATAGHAKIDNVLDAVVRLGIEQARDLVVAHTLRSLFSGASASSKKLMNEAWKHSCRIAALSYILARDVGKLNPERALLAGLLHDIGVMVLIKEPISQALIEDDLIAFNHLCRDLSGQIGAMVLRAWHFGDVFVSAAMEAEHYTKAAVERIQLSDIVMLAHLHDRNPAPWSVAAEKLCDLSIHGLLGAYDLTEDSRLAIVEQAEQELEELTSLLVN